MPNPLDQDPNVYYGSSETGTMTWNGNAIPCLGICNGDKLNKVIYLIATKVCELTDPMDLSTLTLQCALDIFNNEEVGDRTLRKVLQLLLDNDCSLKELIDNIQSQIDGISNTNLVLDLKCLKQLDSFGNALPYTNQSVLQSLINNICDFEQDVINISASLSTLREEFDAHINADEVINEKSITTCINSSSKPISDHVKLIATDYCNYKSLLGTSVQIQSAISKQPDVLNTLLISTPGYTISPENQAVSLGNLWLAYTNLQARVNVMENSCCKITCKDVKIGFNVIVNEDSTITLSFLTSTGTDIPSGMVDLGSVMKITDSKGVSYSYNITISQEGTIGDYSFMGLDTSENLTINIQARLGMEGLECSQCVNKQFNTNGACDFCTLTNTSSSDIVVMYSIANKQRSVTIASEEAYVLPPNSEILYTSNVSELVSSCAKDIPNAELSCYRLKYSTNKNQSSSPNLEAQDTMLRSIIVGGVKYMLNEPNEYNIIEALTNKELNNILLNMTLNVVENTGERNAFTLHFSSPAAIGSTVELELVGPAYEDGLFVKATIEDCPSLS